MEKKKDILHILVLLFAAVQPLVDMDYLIYGFLDSFGLPRFSTVLRFVVLPMLVLAVFIKREKKKLPVFIAAAVYGAALLGYFVLHSRQAAELAVRLSFTENFRFGLFQELTYVLTLVMPFAVIWMCAKERITRDELKKIVCFESLLTSLTIVLGDLFVFGRSTYYGYTVGNVFSWFTGIYDWYHPRTLASKFFFNEGNTVGILMFMLLPLLYYFLCIAEEKQERKRLTVLIFMQSLAMQMLATRVATYGAVFIPVMFLIMYLISVLLLKERKFRKGCVITPLIAAAVFGAMLEFTPAIQNQKVDAVNDVALLHNGMASLGEEELKNAEDLVPGSPEYINFYVYMFETYGINARYIQSVPSMYYTEYYSYQFDPKFWVDVTFMPVFDRVSGRQIETIFFNYKYQNLTPAEKILGMGYSTFMNGSIVLEQDFKQQVYTLGYAGVILCILPWLAVMLYGAVQFLLHFKKLVNLENMIYAVSAALGFGSAWLSGHVLDQFVTSVFMAVLIAVLLNRVQEVQ